MAGAVQSNQPGFARSPWAHGSPLLVEHHGLRAMPEFPRPQWSGVSTDAGNRPAVAAFVGGTRGRSADLECRTCATVRSTPVHGPGPSLPDCPASIQRRHRSVDVGPCREPGTSGTSAMPASREVGKTEGAGRVGVRILTGAQAPFGVDLVNSRIDRLAQRHDLAPFLLIGAGYVGVPDDDRVLPRPGRQAAGVV